MSAFGIGTNTEPADAGAVRGRQINVACECWFSRSGVTKPLLVKYEDEEGTIHTLRDIRVLYQEAKNYGGIPSVEYRCQAVLHQILCEFALIFYMEESRWVLVC